MQYGDLVSRSFRIAVILLTIAGVFLAAILLFRVPQLRSETVRLKAERSALAAKETALARDATHTRQQKLEAVLTERFTRVQLHEFFGKKLFAYELRINGTKISRSNVRFNCSDSSVDITLTESLRIPDRLSPAMLENLSLVYLSAITVHGTTAACASAVQRLPDRTVFSCSFPSIEVGEIITIFVNNPDLATALDLERSVIEITHTSNRKN